MIPISWVKRPQIHSNKSLFPLKIHFKVSSPKHMSSSHSYFFISVCVLLSETKMAG